MSGGNPAGGPFGYADFFDGRSAVQRRVALDIDTGARALVVTPPEADPIRWPLASLREIPDQADRDRLVLTSTEAPLARLTLAGSGVIATIRRHAGRLAARPPVRGRARVLGWAAAAVASVFAIVFLLVPLMADQLARVLPPKGERALGEATLEQIQSALGNDFTDFVPFCSSPGGDAAIATLLRRLDVARLDLPYPVTVRVLDHGLVNAFALPGGQVVFFRGMLEAADGPDEFTAVLAHEIGHVAARDPTRIALRSAGSLGVLGLLFGDFAGGAAVLFLVEQLIRADYSRAAEAAADRFGHDLLLNARIDPGALASLFQTLSDEFGEPEGIAAHFASHPALGDRIAAARAAGQGIRGARPSLDGGQWRALRTICD